MVTLILARILGLYLLAVGLSLILNPALYKRVYSEVVADRTFLFLGALLALIVGATVVSIHNYWVLAWPVIITVLGWWSLVKGFALLSFPDFVKYFAFLENKSDLFYRIVGLVYGAVGAFLLYQGWSLL